MGSEDVEKGKTISHFHQELSLKGQTTLLPEVLVIHNYFRGHVLLELKLRAAETFYPVKVIEKRKKESK